MKHEKLIQEQLKSLPKYSLNSEEKRRVMLHLKKNQLASRKRVSFKPLIAIFFSIVLFSILALHEFNLLNLRAANQPDPIELTAPKGEEFILPDTSSKVIGIPGKVAFLYDNQYRFVAEDPRRGSKLMIYYWGEPSKLIDKNFTVEATNQFGETIILSEGTIYSPLYSEDAHTLTGFKPFPTEGEWQLSFYVEDELHGEFTLDVLPPFPKTEHYTLRNSPKEIEIGRQTPITIESNWEDKEEIVVSLVDKNGVEISKNAFIKDATYIDSLSNNPIYHFSGNLTFPEQGTWTLIIDGEKTQSFEN